MADSSMPFDIQEEIIKGIPDVKSLVRFRSVSKTWKSVIDNPLFVNYHTRRRQQHRPHQLVTYCKHNYSPRLVYDHIYLSVVDDDDSFCQHEVRPTILNPTDSSDEYIEACSSSHGLVCVYPFIDKQQNTRTAVIWNPAIRKSISIDVTIHKTGPYYYNTGVVGFGVCPLTLEPKLVKITWFDCVVSTPWQVEVYSLSSPGLWRSINHNLPRRGTLSFEFQHVVVDRFIYWLSTYYGDEFQGGHCKMIMSFDVTTEEFVQVYLPDSLANNKWVDGLGLSTRMNSLVVIEHIPPESSREDIKGVWKMEEHVGATKTFTKLFNVFITSPADGTLYRVHGFRNNGEPIIEVINQFQKRELHAYEPLLGRLIKFTGIDIDEEEEYIKCVTSYTETLLLLDH